MTDTSPPVVTVVMPVYNSMPYLTETLESVLAQDLDGIEVVAVDDGSTDGSGEELDRFASLDGRVSVVHQPNSGWPGMPRNRGLERARGDFVFFMDSDDTMAPHALRAMVEMAEERNADIVVPRLKGVGGRGVQSLFLSHPHGDLGIARAMETLSPQKLFRRSLIEEHDLRFPEGRVRLEDGIFVTSAYVLARRIAFCGREPLYFIALRGDGTNISASAIDPENYVGSCRRIAEILLEGIDDASTANALVWQLFTRKGLRFYAPKRWLRMSESRRRQWVELHRAFLADLVPVELDARAVNPTDRRKLEYIRAGDIANLDALVTAEHRLGHSAVYDRSIEVPHGVELAVLIAPEGADSLLREVPPPSAARLRAADRLHRLLSPTLGSRIGRGASRRLTRWVTGRGPRVSLLMSGRRVGRAVAIPGRLTSSTGTDPTDGSSESAALRYWFVLPDRLLERFRGDRVDLWTVVEIRPGRSGGRVRLAAKGDVSQRLRTAVVYATDRGNVSLDLREQPKA